jgi:flagellar biosynthesis component FlhA
MSHEQLFEAVRQRIGSLIIQTLVPVKMPLPVITLDGELEGSAGASHADRGRCEASDRAGACPPASPTR